MEIGRKEREKETTSQWIDIKEGREVGREKEREGGKPEETSSKRSKIRMSKKEGKQNKENDEGMEMKKEIIKEQA